MVAVGTVAAPAADTGTSLVPAPVGDLPMLPLRFLPRHGFTCRGSGTQGGWTNRASVHEVSGYTWSPGWAVQSLKA